MIECAPGAGIGWHKDRPHFEGIAGLSPLAPSRFRLRRAREGGGWERDAVLLERRLAYLLAGAARHVWQHSPAHDFVALLDYVSRARAVNAATF